MTGSGAIRWEISRNMLQPALGARGFRVSGWKGWCCWCQKKESKKKSLWWAHPLFWNHWKVCPLVSMHDIISDCKTSWSLRCTQRVCSLHIWKWREVGAAVVFFFFLCHLQQDVPVAHEMQYLRRVNNWHSVNKLFDVLHSWGVVRRSLWLLAFVSRATPHNEAPLQS